MKSKSLLPAALGAMLCSSMLAPADGATSLQQSQPQTKAASYVDVHAQQALGRTIAANDGKFFLYEWGRPYLNWAPDAAWIAPRAARRMQTFLYKVDMSAREPTSEYLFYPKAGCTYWLGDLSPDNKNVIVYELDHDERRVRVGSWDIEKHRMLWFASRPDEDRIESETVWVSNEEFTYPSKDAKGAFVRASLRTGEAVRCASCTSEAVRSAHLATDAAAAQSRQAAAGIDTTDIPKGAVLLTGALNGSLAIFVRDDVDFLSMLYKQPEQSAHVLFENSRHWSGSQALAYDAR